MRRLIFLTVAMLTTLPMSANDYMRDFDQERLKVSISNSYLDFNKDIKVGSTLGVAIGFSGYAYDGFITYDYQLATMGNSFTLDVDSNNAKTSFINYSPKIKVGFVPFSDISISGIVSYNWMKISKESNIMTDYSNSLKGLGYGIEINVPFNDDFGTSIGYEKLDLSHKSTDLDVKSFNIGLNYSF